MFPNKNKRRGEGAVWPKGRGPGSGASRGRRSPGPRTPLPSSGDPARQWPRKAGDISGASVQIENERDGQ